MSEQKGAGVDFAFFMFLCLLSMAICAFVSWNWTSTYYTYRMQQEAIRAGVAEWSINPTTGARAFRYKETP